MNTFLLVFFICLGLGLWYRINMLTFQILHIRKVLLIMADSIATLDLVKKLARAVVSAQESEADAEDARNEAVSALADLKTQVTLDQEASDLVARALGNAVAAPPVDQPAVIDANANGIPDSDEEQVLEEETPVDQPSVVTDGIDVGTANADVEANETKPSEGI